MQTGDPLCVALSPPGFPPSTYSYPGSLQPHCLARLSVKTGAFSQSSSGPTAGREGSGLFQKARQWGTLTSTALSFKGWFPDVSTCFYSLPNADHVSCVYFVCSIESSSAEGGVQHQPLCWGNSGIRAPGATSL